MSAAVQVLLFCPCDQICPLLPASAGAVTARWRTPGSALAAYAWIAWRPSASGSPGRWFCSGNSSIPASPSSSSFWWPHDSVRSPGVLAGKGNRTRTVPMPPWAKAAVDDWLAAAGFSAGLLLGSVNKGDRGTCGRRAQAGVWACEDESVKMRT
jgi:hypothetical protein